MLAHIPSETSGLGFFFIVGDQLILHCETFYISKGCMLLGPVNVFVGELKLQVPGGDTVFFFFSCEVRKPIHTGSQLVCPVLPPTGDTDVFGAASAPSLKEPQKPEQPPPGKSSYVPVSAGLFDDDDDDDDFFAASRSKPPKTGAVPASVSGNVAG